MASVLCKDKNEIFCAVWGNPGSSVFSSSKFDFERLKTIGRIIDTRILNLKRYDGYKGDEHHVTFDSYYKMVIPYLNLYIKTFNFNEEDFEYVPYFSKDMRFNFSYLKPKDDAHRFTLSINGVVVGKHLKFDSLSNAKYIHKDSKVYFGEGIKNDDTEYQKIYRGSHACSVIINETIDNDKKIFISGDSMCIPIIPVLCCYYKKVVFMDNRDGKTHIDYFKDEIFDSVLISFFEGGSENKYLGNNLM